MEIRQATPDDAPLLADSWYAMLDEVGLLVPAVDPEWRTHVITDFRRAIALGAQLWLIAEVDGRPAGTGAVFIRGGRSTVALTGLTATLAGIYTYPPHRHQGIARAIVERLLDLCRERRCRSVRLRASSAGRPLYESLGFVPSDEMLLTLSPESPLEHPTSSS